MKNKTKKAQKVWQEEYGNQKLVKDFSGRYMYFDAYNNRNYTHIINGKLEYCGWNIDHILPISKGGKSVKENLQCVNILTNDEKSNKTTSKIAEKYFQVLKTRNKYTMRQIIK